MHIDHQAIRLLERYRSAELIGEAERLNAVHDARRHRRKFVRSPLTRFRRAASDGVVAGVRHFLSLKPVPRQGSRRA